MQQATRMLPALAALVVALGSVHAQGGKLPEVKELMKRMNKGNDALIARIVRLRMRQNEARARARAARRTSR